MNPSKTDLDPRILGQLLAAQSVSSLLSSRLKMGEFVCRAVEGLPGVASCAVCLPGAERPRLGGEPAPECADCDVPEGDVDHDPGQPCLLTSHVSIQIFPLKTQDRHFGFLLLKLEERERYAPYEPFVSNLADGLAVNIDRQWQKEGLEAANVELRRHREQLGELVRERTAGLEAANEELRISEEELASQLKELQQSRDALRLKNFVFDASISANSIADTNGVITEANAAFLKVWGYTSKEEVVGRPIPDFLQDQDEVAAILAALSTTGEWEGDYTAKRKDGTTFVAHGLATAVRDEGGKVIGYQSAVLDITERRRMEKQLAESELRYRALFDRAPYGVLLIDLETTRAVDFNEPTARQLGYSRAEFAKLRITDYETIETAAETAKHIEKILTEGIDTFETRHRTKNGEIRNVLVSAQRLKLSGRIYVACVFQDISERKQSEEALRRAVADFRRSNEELQQFAYVASHDLQEPLRAVASFTQLLSERYKGRLDTKADEFITFAVEGANRMQTLINDLLSYSRLETRGKPPEATDSHEALGRALANLGTAIRESGALVTNDDLPMVKADESQLVQLFQNLVGNAVKFHGPELPRVHVSAECKGGEWLFSVRDNGIGIAKEYQERIFSIFQRLHSREEYPGTGIGLALCRRIVERHGGTIRVESGPGSGSTFLFTLPKP